MKSQIDDVLALLPPPSNPCNNTGDWSRVEATLGTQLPQDFKEFTSYYGAVKICNYLVIQTPFPVLDRYLAVLHSLSEEYDAVVGGRDNIPYPQFPTPGGIIGIGTTDSADVISWITEGHPDDWGIFFWKWPGLEGEVATYKQLNLTGFLVDLLSLRSPLFPDLMPNEFFSSEQRSVMQIC